MSISPKMIPALLVFSLTRAVPAATPLPLDLDRFCESSQAIVLGTCKQVKCEWNEGRTLIHTYATYDVERIVKGHQIKSEIQIKTVGGTVGRISQVIVGGPQFKLGDRDLLFLVPLDGSNAWQVFALAAGKCRVIRDPATNGDSVVNPPPTDKSLPSSHGAKSTPNDASTKTDNAAAPPVVLVSLEKVIKDIHESIALAVKRKGGRE